MDRLGPDAWAYAVLAAALLVAAVTDVWRGKIYNWLTYPTVAIALAGHFLAGGVMGTPPGPESSARMGLTGSLLGLVAGFAPLMLAWLAGGIGGGDAKIMGAVGALTGWRFALSALFFSLGVAVVMAVAILLWRRTTVQTFRRIGRFVFLTAVRAKPAGPGADDSPRLPFGLALCLGTAVVLTLTLIGGHGDTLYLPGW